MARGSKFSDEIKEMAFALLATNNNVQAVANKLGIPRTTVNTWKKQWEREEKEAVEQSNSGGSTENGSGEVINSGASELTSSTSSLVEARQRKKEEFVDKAWGMLERTQTLLERRIKRAEEHEHEIDELIKDVEKLPGLNQTERNTLYSKLSEIKLESAKSLAVLLGTLYDKQALAAKEPTMNVGGSVTHRWEEL